MFDLDRVAIALSGLCLLHCLALPLALVLVPFAGALADSHWHAPMLALAVPASAAAIVIGYRRHGNRALLAWGFAGLAILVAGGTVAHAWYGDLVDKTLTIVGSLLLATVHGLNSRRLRQVRGRIALAS
ncbi:MAG: MerC domain-containing protein [Woeseiaceae bacterium]|nr:MerC domain-containing protein [Woeseiaceae bacterium]